MLSKLYTGLLVIVALFAMAALGMLMLVVIMHIGDLAKQEAARHAAVVKNMQRLRALRLAREEKRRARNSRLRGQLFNANNRRRVDNQREAQCQLPMIIEQWLKNAFGVRKKPKPTMNAKAISN
jgi:hypothetical protein